MKTANQSTRTVTSRMLPAKRAVQSKGKRRRISNERQSPVPGIHRICKLCKHSLGYELLPWLRNGLEISRLHVFLRRADLGNLTSELRQVPSHYTHRPTTSSITNHYSDRKTFVGKADYFFLAGFLLILVVWILCNPAIQDYSCFFEQVLRGLPIANNSLINLFLRRFACSRRVEVI